MHFEVEQPETHLLSHRFELMKHSPSHTLPSRGWNGSHPLYHACRCVDALEGATSRGLSIKASYDKVTSRRGYIRVRLFFDSF
jgi:hypothetical protein